MRYFFALVTLLLVGCNATKEPLIQSNVEEILLPTYMAVIGDDPADTAHIAAKGFTLTKTASNEWIATEHETDFIIRFEKLPNHENLYVAEFQFDASPGEPGYLQVISSFEKNEIRFWLPPQPLTQSMLKDGPANDKSTLFERFNEAIRTAPIPEKAKRQSALTRKNSYPKPDEFNWTYSAWAYVGSDTLKFDETAIAKRVSQVQQWIDSDLEEEARTQEVAQEAQKLAEQKAAEERRLAAEAAKQEAEKARITNNGKVYGRWIYRIEQDPLTDELRQFLFGIPNGYDDFSNSPFIRIGCYNHDAEWPMGVTFLWGQPLQDVYPSGDFDLARVTARFDSGKPIARKIRLEVTVKYPQVPARLLRDTRSWYHCVNRKDIFPMVF